MEETKLEEMRVLYKQSDSLHLTIKFYTNQYQKELQDMRKKYEL